MDDNKKKNKSPVWAIIAIVYVFLKIAANSDSIELPAIFIGICAAAAIVGIIAGIRKNNMSAAQNEDKTMRVSRLADGEKSARQKTERSMQGMNLPRRRETYTPDNGDKYIAQLNGFLKNGIIDAKEYKTMLERYKRNGIVR